MNKADEKTSFAELIQSDKPVLVDFYTDWCGPCKMMNPILKELKSMVNDEAIVVKVNAERNPEASARYGVRGVPTLILFQNGEIKWRQAGVVQAGRLKSIIAQHTN